MVTGVVEMMEMMALTAMTVKKMRVNRERKMTAYLRRGAERVTMGMGARGSSSNEKTLEGLAR